MPVIISNSIIIFGCKASLLSLSAILTLIISLPLNDGLQTSNTLSLPSNGTLPLNPAHSRNVSASPPAFDSNSGLVSANGVLGRLVAGSNAAPVCNGTMFGTKLWYPSCYNALSNIAYDSGAKTFGDRGHGFDIQLPRRVSSADGTCVIDIFHKDGVISDYANGIEIATATRYIMRTCVMKNEGYSGGYMRDIGRSQNLVIVVSLYNPIVRCCHSVGKLFNTGQALIDAIPTNWTYQKFGPSDIEGVEVEVPQTISSLMPLPYDFYAKIDIQSTQDHHRVTAMGRWWDLWTGAVAINAICVKRDGMTGFAHFEGGLRIQLDIHSPRLEGNAASAPDNSRGLEVSNV